MIRGVHLTRTLWQDLLFWRLHVGVGMVREMLDRQYPRMRARQCISYLQPLSSMLRQSADCQHIHYMYLQATIAGRSALLLSDISHLIYYCVCDDVTAVHVAGRLLPELLTVGYI
jgi:hypothetical protein